METTQTTTEAIAPVQGSNLATWQKDFFSHLEKQGRSRNTLKNYRTDLECFNNYLKKENLELGVADFNMPQIEDYGKYLQEKYSSDNSRRRRVQALRIFFDFLVSNNVYESNPVRKLPTSPKFLDIPRPTPFVDVKTLWSYILEETKSPSKMMRLLALRNQVAVTFIFGAGLKVSDLSGLKRDQVIIEGDEARVMVYHPKRDPYTVPLPKVFVPVYKEYIEFLEVMKAECRLEFDEILFNANPYRILSKGLSPRGLEIIFEDFRKKLMLVLTPKSLRQACIFKWLHQGHSDNLIKEWMGVSPSYSLKLYKAHAVNHIYNDDFLLELYNYYQSKETVH